MRFDFDRSLQEATRVIDDALMQALDRSVRSLLQGRVADVDLAIEALCEQYAVCRTAALEQAYTVLRKLATPETVH